MNARPSCGTPMKPLFVGSFCPNDCDKKIRLTATVAPPEFGWVYTESLGKRWSVTHVLELPTKDGSNGSRTDDFLANPQEFFRHHWHGGTPGWRNSGGMPGTANRTFLQIEEIP